MRTRLNQVVLMENDMPPISSTQFRVHQKGVLEFMRVLTFNQSATTSGHPISSPFSQRQAHLRRRRAGALPSLPILHAWMGWKCPYDVRQVYVRGSWNVQDRHLELICSLAINIPCLTLIIGTSRGELEYGQEQSASMAL